MGKIYQGIEELVGNTPLVNLHRLAAAQGVEAEILAKLEYFNPAGSVKDRIGRQMIQDAEEAGILKKDSVIIEPTSGNTGVGLAAIAAAKGYRAIIIMPEHLSEERKMLMKAHGAELILTEKAKGMHGAIEKAEEILKTVENGWIAGQFVNSSNPKAHYMTTGPEIWEDTDGDADIFVASVGTGGTLTGTGRYLKEKNPAIHIVAVEPSGSPVLSGGKPGPHGIQGIGAGFVPDILDTQIYDEIIQVEEKSAYEMGRLLSAKEGFLAGISSGSALWAAVQLGLRPENKGKKIVVILPDTGERYLSTELFRQ